MAKVSHIVLPVSDVQRSREWYVNQLGFTLERELEQAVGDGYLNHLWDAVTMAKAMREMSEEAKR